MNSKSRFVTILSWTSILIAGWGTLMALIENIIFSVIPVPLNEIKAILYSGKGEEFLPPIFLFVLSHIRIFLLVYLVVAGITFISALRLLRRKNWARIFFICLLSMGIIWNLTEIFFSRVFTSKILEYPDLLTGIDFSNLSSLIWVSYIIISLSFITLYAWIIKKLVSKEIREEFTPLEKVYPVRNKVSKI